MYKPVERLKEKVKEAGERLKRNMLEKRQQRRREGHKADERKKKSRGIGKKPWHVET